MEIAKLLRLGRSMAFTVYAQSIAKGQDISAFNVTRLSKVFREQTMKFIFDDLVALAGTFLLISCRRGYTSSLFVKVLLYKR
jgi:hypothetical protein